LWFFPVYRKQRIEGDMKAYLDQRFELSVCSKTTMESFKKSKDDLYE